MNDLWTRIQLAKVKYGMQALHKPEFIQVLGHLYAEATLAREASHDAI